MADRLRQVDADARAWHGRRVGGFHRYTGDRAPCVPGHAVGDPVAVNVAEVDEYRERIGPRRDIGDRLGRFDHQRGATCVHARADGRQPDRVDRRRARGRGRRLDERAGCGHRRGEDDASIQRHSFSSPCSSFDTSRRLTTDNGSSTSWMKIMPSGVMLLMAPSRSLSPACTM